MPLYEYRCSTCNRRFEVLQRMGQGPEGLTCPKCGGKEVEKQLSTFSSSTGGGDLGAAFSGGGCGAGGSGFS